MIETALAEHMSREKDQISSYKLKLKIKDTELHKGVDVDDRDKMYDLLMLG